MDLTFSGAGFMGCYYFGVVDCWKKYIPSDRVNRVAGASAGSLIAAYYLMDLPLKSCLREIVGLSEEIRSRSLGVFDRNHQIVDELPKILDRLFPDDAHKQVSGRLHVCMTRLKDMKKVMVSEFDSKKDLIDALNCSCFIPVWSGNHVATYKGIKHIDGGLSDNLPIFDEKTIRVCCFAGRTDISPYDRVKSEFLSSTILNTPLYFNFANCRRGVKALFPPPASFILRLLERGFHDTKQFILTNDLIQCQTCYSKATAKALAADHQVPASSPQNRGGLLIVPQDRFTLAPSPLPSCPPSPNLNRHCTECIQMRQGARVDLVENEVRQEAQKYIPIPQPLKGSRLIKSKLSSKLRWFTQIGTKNSYKFQQEPQQIAFEDPKQISLEDSKSYGLTHDDLEKCVKILITNHNV